MTSFYGNSANREGARLCVTLLRSFADACRIKTKRGLPRKTSLFTSNMPRALEAYKTYKDTLKTRKQYPFTRVFASYNASSANEVPVLVDSTLGGYNKLILPNMSLYNREIRRMGSM